MSLLIRKGLMLFFAASCFDNNVIEFFIFVSVVVFVAVVNVIDVDINSVLGGRDESRSGALLVSIGGVIVAIVVVGIVVVIRGIVGRRLFINLHFIFSFCFFYRRVSLTL